MILFYKNQFSNFADYSVHADDIYHYATHSNYQDDAESPPLPDPPSPVHHAHPSYHGPRSNHGQQKGFSTVVYQPASLHDVDGANIVSII